MSHRNDTKYSPSVKNSTGHRKFAASCRAYTVSARSLRASDTCAVQIRYDAMPMRIYSAVHATGKSHCGGASGGFAIVSNSFMPSFVRNAASPPTASGSAMAAISCLSFILCFTFITRISI